MKAITLTKEILTKLKPKTILYAEFAEEGAMGACGTARIYTLEKQKLQFYLIDDVSQNEENAKVYSEAGVLLNKLKEEGVLDYEYAGYGNHGYKKTGLKFTRDDDDAIFVYHDADKSYKMPASCNGVYAHLVAKFAEREVSIRELEEYLEKNRFKFVDGEAEFFEQYLAQSKRTDAGQDWFDFTAFDYYNAVKYLRHLSGEDYLLDQSEILECKTAIYKYRFSYVVDKLGWNKLNKIFVQLVQGGRLDLFQRVEAALGEKIDEIYGTLEVIRPEESDLKDLSADYLEKLFSRPIVVEFPKTVHNKILKDIYERSSSSFNPDAEGIAYYFANYLFNEDTLSLADALPAAMHTIEVLPNDDFNHTHTDELFWLCGQLVDQAWRYLEENEEVQKKYRQILYEIYWPRIGSLWPVLHRDEFEFKWESAAKIFDDAFSFVMSLEDITELNGEVKGFLEANAERIGYKAGPLGRRAFIYTMRGLSTEEEFERILEVVEPNDYDSFLSYPDTVESARLLLDELFRVDAGARITGYSRMAVLEGLVLRPNTIGVGEYVLDYLNRNFEQLVKIVSTEVIQMGLEPVPVMTDLFIAMSKGVTEENEFPAFKAIGQKMLELGCNAREISNAEKYARRHRRTILFQRSALQKLF